MPTTPNAQPDPKPLTTIGLPPEVTTACAAALRKQQEKLAKLTAYIGPRLNGAIARLNSFKTMKITLPRWMARPHDPILRRDWRIN